VLEKAAAFIEAVEDTKIAEIHTARLGIARELASKIAESTGEKLDEETVAKLARADKEILQTIGKLATEANDEVMGKPSDRRDPSAPVSGKEAIAAAEEALVNFCLSR
jgi:hypothetical protein